MIDNNSKEFIKRHIGPSDEDQSKMLTYVGYNSLKDLMTNTIEFANSLLNNGLNAISMSLKCINQSSGTVLNDGLDFELRTFRELFKSEETREGLNAFVEKRKARFK